MVMTKSFSKKEITNTPALCKEYNKLFNQLPTNEKLGIDPEECLRQDISSETEAKSSKYLVFIDNQINLIKEADKTITDNEIKIISSQISP
jgi:hypothetical protein